MFIGNILFYNKIIELHAAAKNRKNEFWVKGLGETSVNELRISGRQGSRRMSALTSKSCCEN